MKAQLDTPSREAFEYYREAISCIDTYRASGNPELVEEGGVLLDAALKADPEWTRPTYLRCILQDLKGDPQAAIDGLKRWKDISDSSFGLEVKLNLGAAHYHRYKEEHLKEAETLFQEVKSKASGTLQPLALLASSSLAQVYGMRVLEEPAEEWYKRCRSEAHNALDGLEKWKASKDFQTDRGEIWVAQEIEWAAQNAIGFGGSFWSDRLDPNARVPILENSISLFNQGLELRPNHWASLSNLASAKMRLGAAFRRLGRREEGEQRLSEALEHIDSVVKREVPADPAFALFERGRILRLLARFGEAIVSLDNASAVPENLSTLSCEIIAAERARATGQQTDFPNAPV